MPTITENDIEPCVERFESEHTLAVPLVFGRMSQDSLERYLPTPADAISDVTATGEGA